MADEMHASSGVLHDPSFNVPVTTTPFAGASAGILAESLVDSRHVGALHLDGDDRVLLCSRTFHSLLGLEPGLLSRGHPLAQLLMFLVSSSREPVKALADLTRILAEPNFVGRVELEMSEGRFANVEVCPRRSDGSRVILLYGERPTPFDAVAIADSESLFRTSFMHSPLPMSLCTVPDGRYFAVNDEHLRLMECAREEVIGKSAREHNRLFDPADHDRIAMMLYRDGLVRDYETGAIRRDGSIVCVIISCTLICLQGQAMVLSICKDISEQRAAEARLRDEREKFEITLSNIGDAVVNVDANLRIVLLNAKAEDLLGWSSADARGMGLDELVHIRRGNSASETASSAISSGISVGNLRDLERSRSLVSRDGGAHEITLRASPLRTRTSVGCVLVIHDVADDIEFERMKCDFIAGVSHELRTPLTSIKGSIDTILRNPGMSSEVRTDFLEIAQRQAARLERLVREILLLSRIDQPASSREAIDMAQVCRAALEEVNHEVNRKQQNLWVSLGEIDAMHLFGHRDELVSLVANLLSNAVKFTPDGGLIKLLLSREEAHLTLRVEDNGIGIPVADQPRVFQRFFRSSKVSRDFSGTGLGLAIVKEIVDSHGGTLKLESTEGVGTAVRVRLPLSAPTPSWSGVD